MNKIIPILIGILLFINTVSALEISPTSVSETLAEGETRVVPITLTNTQNASVSVTISSDNTAIVKPGVTSLTLEPFGDVTLNLFLYSVGGTTSLKVDSQSIPITVDVAPSAEGKLEPSFTKLKTSMETNTRTTRIFSIKNKYPNTVDVIDINPLGSILTKSGKWIPLDWEGELKSIDPNKDLVLTLTFDTAGLKPGSYPVTLQVAYYYQDTRHELDINFEIQVLEALLAEDEIPIRDMSITVNPSAPSTGDFVAVLLKDTETGNTVQGDIKILQYTDSTLQTSFTYMNPFEAENGRRYVINVTADGYHSIESSFMVGLEETRILYSPKDVDVGDEVEFSYVDSSGDLIDTKIKINDVEYDNPCRIILEEGNYVIKAEKEGYEASQTSLTIRKPLKVISIPESGMVGENLTIEFEEDEEYIVMMGNKVYKDSIGKEFSFTPDSAGNYTVYARGDEVGRIEVLQGFVFPTIDWTGISWLIIILLVVLLFIWPGWLRKKRKKKFKNIGMGSPGQTGPLITEPE